MNWTGGGLQRHLANNRSTLKQRRAHFARVRSARRLPGVSQVQQQSDHNPLFVAANQVAECSKPDHKHGNRSEARNDTGRYAVDSRTAPSELSLPAHRWQPPVSRDAVRDDLPAYKRHLLDASDWLGLDHPVLLALGSKVKHKRRHRRHYQRSKRQMILPRQRSPTNPAIRSPIWTQDIEVRIGTQALRATPVVQVYRTPERPAQQLHTVDHGDSNVGARRTHGFVSLPELKIVPSEHSGLVDHETSLISPVLDGSFWSNPRQCGIPGRTTSIPLPSAPRLAPVASTIQCFQDEDPVWFNAGDDDSSLFATLKPAQEQPELQDDLAQNEHEGRVESWFISSSQYDLDHVDEGRRSARLVSPSVIHREASTSLEALNGTRTSPSSSPRCHPTTTTSFRFQDAGFYHSSPRASSIQAQHPNPDHSYHISNAAAGAAAAAVGSSPVFTILDPRSTPPYHTWQQPHAAASVPKTSPHPAQSPRPEADPNEADEAWQRFIFGPPVSRPPPPPPAPVSDENVPSIIGVISRHGPDAATRPADLDTLSLAPMVSSSSSGDARSLPTCRRDRLSTAVLRDRHRERYWSGAWDARRHGRCVRRGARGSLDEWRRIVWRNQGRDGATVAKRDTGREPY